MATSAKKSSLETLANVLMQGSGIHAKYEDKEAVLKYTLRGEYRPDYHIKRLGPFKRVLVETKGHFSSQDRRKMRAVKEAHPEALIVMVFGRVINKLNKNSDTTYGQWCEKHDIMYCDIKDFQKGDIKECLLSILRKHKSGLSKTPRRKN